MYSYNEAAAITGVALGKAIRAKDVLDAMSDLTFDVLRKQESIATSTTLTPALMEEWFETVHAALPGHLCDTMTQNGQHVRGNDAARLYEALGEKPETPHDVSITGAAKLHIFRQVVRDLAADRRRFPNLHLPEGPKAVRQTASPAARAA
jgi:hypothetical protein